MVQMSGLETLYGPDRPQPWLFALSAILFGIGFAITFVAVTTVGLPSGGQEGMARRLASLDTPLEIFLNNVLVLVAILAGAGTFGLSSFLFLSLNGAYMGAIAAYGLKIGYGPVGVATLIVPHGLFEFPAFWLAGAVGFTIPVRVVNYLGGSQDRILCQGEPRQLLATAAASIVLLAIGAVVEATVTPRLAALL